MATIHKTTLKPGKLELLAAWLPGQPWYQGTGGTPQLGRAGGFRLDDPAGEVGIEFMVVTDTSGGGLDAYQVPLTYRGAPIAGPDADGALIGTAEHDVLGTRYVYDGVRDPVLLNQLIAFLNGAVQAQAQGVSDTPDPSVTAHLAGPRITVAAVTTVTSGRDGTDVALAGGPSVHIVRMLAAGGWAAAVDLPGYVQAPWTEPDGTVVRGLLATVRD
jgi:hypothetical protein